MPTISTATRKNIFDGLQVMLIPWYGRLNQVDFLSRVFNLADMPSRDSRFPDASEDIWQHTINNFDWDDEWVYSDPRLNLLHGPDDVFLHFLCEMLHPLVRDDEDEIARLVTIVNRDLAADAWEIVETSRIGDRPVFSARPRPVAALHQLRVFLCHSSGDKAAVRDLYRRLDAEGTIDPWLDEEKLLPGHEWEYEIRQAVRTTDVVLVCLSPSSITKRGYVQKEIIFALDVADQQPEGTIFIIPVRLEACTVPDRLQRWQWVDLFDSRGYERLVRALQSRARALASMDGTVLP